MGIKLDWQVESEYTQLDAAEDPAARQHRRRARRRLVLLVVGLVSVLALVGGLIIWRLNQVEAQYRQDLVDTVKAEITALKAGNAQDFAAIQRSSSTTFLVQQEAEYNQYRQWIEQGRIDLTNSGAVLDTAIDDRRARVVVKETLDGAPYKVVWFYWYYQDGDPDERGWRRVPDDLTFWGKERALDTEHVTVNYHALDEDFAQALAPQINTWWTQGCQIAGCPEPVPALQVDIVAEAPPRITWDTYDDWTLTITSPLLDRARLDDPLAPHMGRDIAGEIIGQIAARQVRYLAGDMVLVSYSDAVWLEGKLVQWLATAIRNSEASLAGDPGFTGSLVRLFGPDAPRLMLHSLAANTTLGDALFAVTGVSADMLSAEQLDNLNWTGFILWRLMLESQLAQPDTSGAFLTLYDMANPDTAPLAHQRQESPAHVLRYTTQADLRVESVQVWQDTATGHILMMATITRQENDTTRTESITWRLAQGSWRRVN
jgi:hypothetical protein